MSDINESAEEQSERSSDGQKPGIGSKVKGFYNALSDQELVVEVLDVNAEQQ
jgi:hypothetical protein